MNNKLPKHWSKDLKENEKELYRQHRREYYFKNKDHILKRQKSYRDNDRERYVAYDRKHYMKNCEEIKLKTRKRNIKHRYSLSIEEYEELKSSYNGVCPICRNERELLLDHDHNNNFLRKFICRNCNLALGYVDDNTQTLINMIEYLKEYNGI